MKSIVIIPLIVAALQTVNAQNTASKADDMARIVLSTYVSPSLDLPDAVRTLLESKLSQIATSQGMGGASASPRFMITANVVQTNKDVTPTAPPQVAMQLDATLFVADFQTKTKYAATTLSLKGVGQNDNKAFMEAIKQINPNNPKVRQFVDMGKTKILEYYNTQCDFILKRAQTLVAQNKFEEALFELTSVPEVCKECYDKAMDASGPVYKAYIDRTCEIKLNEAKNAFNASPDYLGAEKAGAALSQIDPQAACYKEAQAYADVIKEKIQALEKRDWDFKMKAFDTSVEVEKQRIEAYRQVGIAYGENQPKTQVISDPRDWLFR